MPPIFDLSVVLISPSVLVVALLYVVYDDEIPKSVISDLVTAVAPLDFYVYVGRE